MANPPFTLAISVMGSCLLIHATVERIQFENKGETSGMKTLSPMLMYPDE
jgi:hypothetical protein